ncbi:MAG: PEGA domain-containing protein [Myxococcaceae bacterium]
MPTRVHPLRPAPVLLAALALAGCVRAPPPLPPAPPPPVKEAVAPPPEGSPLHGKAGRKVTPGLKFRVSPPEAEIVIDGVSRGAAGALSSSQGLLPLPVGIYQVSLRAKGYDTWRAEVAVRHGPELIQVTLLKSP